MEKRRDCWIADCGLRIADCFRIPNSEFRIPIPARRGISLLEVLISMFILLFGMLGVASMFPVGQYHVSRASRYDYASAVGQSAFNQLLTLTVLESETGNPRCRSLCEMPQWRDPSLSVPPAPPLTDLVERGTWRNPDGRPLNWANWSAPFAIDPLGVAQIPNYPGLDLRLFPAGAPNSLRRHTLTGDVPQSAGQHIMSRAMAEHYFTARDDTVIEIPEDGDNPSILPRLPRRPFAGDYSWAVTVTPAMQPAEGQAADTFVISVVVFYKRFLGGEWWIRDALVQGVIGGGILRLSGSQEQLSSIREGEWIMVRQRMDLNSADPPFLSWYRIVGLGRIDFQNDFNRVPENPNPSVPDSRYMIRWVTVEGRTWGGFRANVNPQRPLPERYFEVSVFDSAVAVYEKTVRFDGTTAWAVP